MNAYPELREAARRMREDHPGEHYGFWNQLATWLEVTSMGFEDAELYWENPERLGLTDEQAKVRAGQVYPNAPSVPIGVAGAYLWDTRIEHGEHFADREMKICVDPDAESWVACVCGERFVGSSFAVGRALDQHIEEAPPWN